MKPDERGTSVYFPLTASAAHTPSSLIKGTRAPTGIGGVDQYKVHELLKMMLFVSEKGGRDQKNFEEQPVYVYIDDRGK
jgi:hypothetical protein